MRPEQRIKKGAWIKPTFWGMILGAILTMIVGFVWGGWVTGGTAESMAQELVATRIAAIVTPICVDKFKKDPDKLTKFKNTSNWNQARFIETSGFANAPGTNELSKLGAKRCAELIKNPKTKTS